MSNFLMVPVKPVKADLLTELNQTIYVPLATKNTYGSVKIGDGLNIDNGIISFDESEVTILSISLNGEPLTIDSDKNVDIELSKNDVGLDQVDNTSDMNKPISTAQQTALNLKLDKKQSSADIGKVAYVNEDGDIDFKNVGFIKVKLNDEVIDTDAGIFNFSNNFVVTSVDGGQVDIDLSEEFKESVGKIDSISLNGVPQTIDENKNVNLVIPIDDKLDKSNVDRNVLTNQTISINGDNVSLVNSYINLNSLVTKTQSNIFSLANDNQAGLMSVSDYKSIRDLQARVGQLEQKATRLLYDEKLYPTAEEINTFVTSLGYTAPFEGIAVVVSGTNHIWHYYEGGTGWKDDGVDVVSQFTNDIAGIIKGSASDGKVYAETDGTGSVYGWDALKNNVTNLSNQFVNYTPTSNLSAVALSGSYNDLLNKPSLSTVATSGNYNDLTNKPVLSAVAISNSYNDLDDKPIIPEGVQLYSTTGQNTDGAMTQKAVTDALPQVVTVTLTGTQNFNDIIITNEQFDLLLSNPENYLIVEMTSSNLTVSLKYRRSQYFTMTSGNLLQEALIFNCVNPTSFAPYAERIDSITLIRQTQNGETNIAVQDDTLDFTTFVPKTRTINGKSLTNNITLTATDVNALPDTTEIPTININGVAQSTINFDSDPQTQIDDINDSIGNISTILATVVTVSEV